MFPRGSSCSADTGFCTLLINAPAGAYIKGNLLMGKQVRALEHTWPERGNHGRAKFCRWDAAVEGDYLVVGIEIFQANLTKVDEGVLGSLKLHSHVPHGALQDVQDLAKRPATALQDTLTPAGKRTLYGTLSPLDGTAKVDKGTGKRMGKEKMEWLRKVPPMTPEGRGPTPGATMLPPGAPRLYGTTVPFGDEGSDRPRTAGVVDGLGL